MNQGAELHDSEVTKIEIAGTDLTLHFRLYIHESEGRPGIDPGTGWFQPACLILRGAAMKNLVSKSLVGPIVISEGVAMLGGRRYENVFPLPIKDIQGFELDLTADSGRKIHFEAASARLELIGESGRD